MSPDVVSLDELVQHPERVSLLPYPQREAALARAAGLLVALASSGARGDRLLSVKEAAHKLGCAEATLYKNKRHPARVHNGRSVRFSEAAIDALIQRRLRGQQRP